LLSAAVVEDESLPIGKQFQPGGNMHDFFFEAAPRWTVGNALNRILTKVKNNPEYSVRRRCSRRGDGRSHLVC